MTKIFVFEYLTGGGIDPALAAAGSQADLSALIVEGRLMRDALVADLRHLSGVEVTFATSRFETVDPSRAHCMAMRGESLTAFVARAAREHDYAWVIAPECDGLLLHLYDAVGAQRWLGCAKEAIRTASSKSATAACLAAHGMAATAALEPGQAGDAPHARWVVKPDDGAGGLDTCVYERLADACADYEARAATARNPVMQQWVEGEPLSLSLICRSDAAELVSINRQRIGLRAREVPGHRAQIVEFDGVSVDQIDRASDEGQRLGALAQGIVRALPGLRGFVGVDVVWHPVRGPVVIEVNPRLTVAYAGLASRGRRGALTRALLAAHGVPVARAAVQPPHEAASTCGAQS